MIIYYCLPRGLKPSSLDEECLRVRGGYQLLKGIYPLENFEIFYFSFTHFRGRLNPPACQTAVAQFDVISIMDCKKCLAFLQLSVAFCLKSK